MSTCDGKGGGFSSNERVWKLYVNMIRRNKKQPVSLMIVEDPN